MNQTTKQMVQFIAEADKTNPDTQTQMRTASRQNESQKGLLATPNIKHESVDGLDSSKALPQITEKISSKDVNDAKIDKGSTIVEVKKEDTSKPQTAVPSSSKDVVKVDRRSFDMRAQTKNSRSRRHTHASGEYNETQHLERDSNVVSE